MWIWSSKFGLGFRTADRIRFPDLDTDPDFGHQSGSTPRILDTDPDLDSAPDPITGFGPCPNDAQFGPRPVRIWISSDPDRFTFDPDPDCPVIKPQS